MPNQTLLSTRLEKAAQDNGFDLPKPNEGDWLAFLSSHCPLKIWLSGDAGGKLLFAVSDSLIGRHLDTRQEAELEKLPSGAMVIFSAPDFPTLYSLIKRCFQLSRSLPSEPLREFQKQTQSLPKTTEIERTIIQRVGQDIFRERLIAFWDGKCAVSGLAIPALLKASHIKPWSKCASDAERLDVFNGLLLAPHLDAVFDRGFVTFGDDGSLIVSKNLGNEGLKILGIDMAAKCDGLTSAHQKYLAWHRANEFQGK